MQRNELLQRLRSHFSSNTSETRGFTIFDLLHKYGSPLSALFYSHLFWPVFVEIEGMVFLRDFIEDATDQDRIKEAMVRLGHDRRKVEESFNFVEIPSLFGRHMDDTSDEEDELLASILCETWDARLRQQFPGRTFDVELVPASNEGSEVGILFRQR